jgi:hypothetical protein
MMELLRLSELSHLDLFVYLREMENFGFPSLVAKVDECPTIGTVSRIVDCQLGKGLIALLAALRAGHAHADKVERSSGSGCSLPGI